jgi:hypothetical protein
MNIFILDLDPVISASMLCDKHVVKMIVESAQMLSTAHRILDGKFETGLSKTGERKIKKWHHPNEELYFFIFLGNFNGIIINFFDIKTEKKVNQ